MIRDSVAYMVQQGREVIFDAEHFFDGFDADSEYALAACVAAAVAGAGWVVGCDTNGGRMPHEWQVLAYWNMLALLLLATSMVLIRLKQEQMQGEIDSVRRFAHEG